MRKKETFFILIITFMFMVISNLMGAPTPTTDKDDRESDQTVIRRFALVIGANDGGPRRVKLRYAVSDAKSILNVLETMGGVSPDDSRLLVQPSRESFFWEIKRLTERVERARANHPRVEVILYYSGHSDEKHFLIGKNKIPYRNFQEEINRMDADVRITILDSCASGAFTRLKGGKKRASFLIDNAYDMKGYAIMTSSSSDEASQESDRLAGSYFTHYLISGLRGAADTSRDGRITLNEAYQFAFNETLTQTADTMSGPQHPNQHIQMSGTGDVVMTDIRKSSSVLSITKNIAGRIFIHNQKNILVVELNKPAGQDIELGLEQGKYRIINIADNHVFEAKIHLPKGKRFELGSQHFKEMDKTDTVARGDLNAQKRKVFSRKGKLNFFAALVGKFTRARGLGTMMSGIKLGLTFKRSISIGLAGFINNGDFPMGHPVYWGLTVEYALPSTSIFNVKFGALMGSGEGTLLSDQFYIVEPELTVTLNITRLLNINTGISYRITDKERSSLAPLSWFFSLRFGK
jgi:hypothetical protein